MKSKLILTCAVVAILLCLLGCAAAPQEVSVDASYSGKEVELVVGGSVIVTLESNPGSTGFEWGSAEISDETVLQQVDQRYEAPEEGSMIGAPGKEIWTFKGLKKGESSISMEYSQPWEGGTKAAETFELTVVVK